MFDIWTCLRFTSLKKFSCFEIWAATKPGPRVQAGRRVRSHTWIWHDEYLHDARSRVAANSPGSVGAEQILAAQDDTFRGLRSSRLRSNWQKQNRFQHEAEFVDGLDCTLGGRLIYRL